MKFFVENLSKIFLLKIVKDLSFIQFGILFFYIFLLFNYLSFYLFFFFLLQKENFFLIFDGSSHLETDSSNSNNITNNNDNDSEEVNVCNNKSHCFYYLKNELSVLNDGPYWDKMSEKNESFWRDYQQIIFQLRYYSFYLFYPWLKLLLSNNDWFKFTLHHINTREISTSLNGTVWWSLKFCIYLKIIFR